MIDLDTPEGRDHAAGEFVLGTLDAEEQATFEVALARDLGLQAAVYEWQDRLLPLSAQAAAVAPRPQLWARIEASRLALLDTHARPAAPKRLPWWQRLGWWQGLSGAALALSLVLATMLVQRPAEPIGPRYLALLQSPQDQTTGWRVEVGDEVVRLVPVADSGAVPPGKSLQFWTKLQGAAGPTSLGLVKAGQTIVLPRSRLPGVGTQQLFEITLEPAGGSPLGRPTGPILYVGRSVAM